MDTAHDDDLGEAATAPVTPLIREITVEELKKEWDDQSAKLALELRDTICDTHENCDGSCSDGAVQAPPLIGSFENLPTVLRPSRATAQDFPRDSCWVDQQTLSKHTYEPITSSAGEIRLLKVKRGLFRSDIVECELVTTSLDQEIPYQALSYCCGTAGTTEVMLCNGRKHHIYPSLNNALKAFRQSIFQDFHLWTDAVSIDQADKAELSEQIPLMRRIYAEAAGVFVYLGEADRQWSLGLDLMHRLAIVQQHRRHPELHGGFCTDVDLFELIYEEHPCWTEYYGTFLLPWFCRTWILQEVALAKIAVVAIGRYLISWCALDQSARQLSSWTIEAYKMKGFHNFLEMQEIFQCVGTPGLTLFDVLRRTQGFQVSDPRDKIIGLLGMLEDTTGEVCTLSDHKLTKAQVYHKAAMYLLRSDAPEVTIEYAGLQNRVGPSDMPSWVTDWQAIKRPAFPIAKWRRGSPKAGGNSTCVWHEEGDDADYPSSVSVFGFCHHKIIKHSDALSALDRQQDRHKINEANIYSRWLASAQDCLRSSNGLVYHDLEDAFARTLITDNMRGHTPDHELLPTFRLAVSLLEEIGGRFGSDPVMRGMIREMNHDQVKRYVFFMAIVIKGRRFAITDTGYMCLVPECSRIGDEVAMFLGFQVPYTIRPQSDFTTGKEGWEQVRAQLVGDAYMHGMMKGESGRTGRPHCQINLV